MHVLKELKLTIQAGEGAELFVGKGEEQQQERDCMVEVDDIVQAWNGLRLKIEPAEVCHNVHYKHVCDLQAIWNKEYKETHRWPGLCVQANLEESEEAASVACISCV